MFIKPLYYTITIIYHRYNITFEPAFSFNIVAVSDLLRWSIKPSHRIRRIPLRPPQHHQSRQCDHKCALSRSTTELSTLQTALQPPLFPRAKPPSKESSTTKALTPTSSRTTATTPRQQNPQSHRYQTNNGVYSIRRIGG